MYDYFCMCVTEWSGTSAGERLVISHGSAAEHTDTTDWAARQNTGTTHTQERKVSVFP